METEGERISDIISHFCESKADFARKMEESPQTISNWVSRGAGRMVGGERLGSLELFEAIQFLITSTLTLVSTS